MSWLCISLHACMLSLARRLPDCWLTSTASLSLPRTASRVLLQHKDIHSYYVCANNLTTLNTHCFDVWTLNTAQVYAYMRICFTVPRVVVSSISFVPRTLRSLGVHHWSMDNPRPRLVWMMEGSVVMNQLEPGQGLDCVIPSWRNIVITPCRVYMYNNKLPPKLQSPRWLSTVVWSSVFVTVLVVLCGSSLTRSAMLASNVCALTLANSWSMLCVQNIP